MAFFDLPADVWKEVIGLIAGLILLISGLPVLVSVFRKAGPGTRSERISRLAMAIGNALWVIAGIVGGLWSVALMCSLNAMIQGAIWLRMRRALNA